MSWEGGGMSWEGRDVVGGGGLPGPTQERPGPLDRTHHTRSAGSMGKWGNQDTEREVPMPTFQWEEIQKHNLRIDKWLVINRKVYNITKWSSRHRRASGSSGTTPGRCYRRLSWPSTATSVLCSSS